MPNGEQLLIETHGMVKEMSGKIGALEQDIKDGKDARRRIHERQDKMERSYVKKTDCALTEEKVTADIKNTIAAAIDGKKRARGLIIKDIILGVLGTGGVGAVLLLWLLDKL